MLTYKERPDSINESSEVLQEKVFKQRDPDYSMEKFPALDEINEVPSIFETRLTDSEDLMIHFRYTAGPMEWYVAECFPMRKMFYGYCRDGAAPDKCDWKYFSLSDMERLAEDTGSELERDGQWVPKVFNQMPLCEHILNETGTGQLYLENVE